MRATSTKFGSSAESPGGHDRDYPRQYQPHQHQNPDLQLHLASRRNRALLRRTGTVHIRSGNPRKRDNHPGLVPNRPLCAQRGPVRAPPIRERLHDRHRHGSEIPAADYMERRQGRLHVRRHHQPETRHHLSSTKEHRYLRHDPTDDDIHFDYSFFQNGALKLHRRQGTVRQRHALPLQVPLPRHGGIPSQQRQFLRPLGYYNNRGDYGYHDYMPR